MWLGKSEGLSFWMGAGMWSTEYIITCTDNLNGFMDTIRNVFPQSSIHSNLCGTSDQKACKYFVYKDKKIRKCIKSKLSFPSDDAVKKTVYLSLLEIEK